MNILIAINFCRSILTWNNASLQCEKLGGFLPVYQEGTMEYNALLIEIMFQLPMQNAFADWFHEVSFLGLHKERVS